MEIDWSAILSTLFGGGIGAALIKIFISKSIKELEELSGRIRQIDVELARLAERIAHISRMYNLVLTHDSRLARLEATVGLDATEPRRYDPS